MPPLLTHYSSKLQYSDQFFVSVVGIHSSLRSAYRGDTYSDRQLAAPYDIEASPFNPKRIADDKEARLYHLMNGNAIWHFHFPKKLQKYSSNLFV